MKKGCNYPEMEGIADNMNPETLLSLKEDFLNFVGQRPHLKHFTFEEFMNIAKHCRGLYGLVSDGKIKIKKRPLIEPPLAATMDEEPQIISSCRYSRKIPHIFCSLPTGICKIISSPNRLRQFDLHGRTKQ